jgi:hypothetical protein
MGSLGLLVRACVDGRILRAGARARRCATALAACCLLAGAWAAGASASTVPMPASQAGEAARIPGITLTHGGRGVVADVARGSRRGATGPQGAAPAALPDGVPVRSLWTATSRTYAPAADARGRGRQPRVTRIFSTPVNVKDAHGVWRPIDDTLVPTTEPAALNATGARAASASAPAAGRVAAVTNRMNAYRVVVPTSLGAPVRVSTVKGWVAFSLRGAHGRGRVRGDRIAFARALPGASLTYVAQGGGVK